MQGLAPVDSGDLVHALKAKFRKDGLRVQVGLVTKKDNDEIFYARFVEFGTKGYSVGERRIDSKGGKHGKVTRNIPARSAQPFMRPAWQMNIHPARKRLQTALHEALKETVSRSRGAHE
jgi:HK97 gp10 family phage protein